MQFLKETLRLSYIQDVEFVPWKEQVILIITKALVTCKVTSWLVKNVIIHKDRICYAISIGVGARGLM